MLSDPGGSFHQLGFAWLLGVAFVTQYSLDIHSHKISDEAQSLQLSLTACTLSVYASLWSLPSSLQDSIRGPISGLPRWRGLTGLPPAWLSFAQRTYV